MPRLKPPITTSKAAQTIRRLEQLRKEPDVQRAKVVTLSYRDKYKILTKRLLDTLLGDDILYVSFNGAYYMCNYKTCDKALPRGHMPL